MPHGQRPQAESIVASCSSRAHHSRDHGGRDLGSPVVDRGDVRLQRLGDVAVVVPALVLEPDAVDGDLVGVAIDDNPGLVEERLKKLGVTYTNVLDDGASSVRGAYQVTDLPSTFIFDKKGVLRVVTRGGDEADVAKIQDAVEFLLSE